MQSNIKRAAEKYIDQGMTPIPVIHMSKKPAISGWQNRTRSSTNIEDDFPDGQDHNIGIVLGSASGNLADIDLDCPEAVRIANKFLPETGMVFGRHSAPKSHWVFRVRNCSGRIGFSGPNDEGMLVEYRGDRSQTVFPPSTHESGEVIRFDSDGEPAHVDHDVLIKGVRHLAAASLIAKHWHTGKRHDIAMALSGTLLRAQWFDDDVMDFIEAVCIAANDDDIADRKQAVKDTQVAIDGDVASTGRPRLKMLIGDSVVDYVCECLNLDANNGIGHNSDASIDNVLRCSDIGNASAFAEQNRHHLRYCYDLGTWLAWTGKYWKVDGKARLDRLAENTVRSFPVEAASVDDRSDRDALMEWALRSGNRPRVKAMTEQSRHHIQIDQDKLDADPMILNVDGAIINLTDGTTRPNTPENFCTKLTRVKYDPDAKCPVFMAFLDRIMADSNPMMSYLQRAAGYSLTGSTKEQCFFIAHGTGANGKSVFLNILRDLMGSYGLNMAMDTLMSKSKGGGIPNDIARLCGIRMVTAMEGESNQKMAESLVKSMTGSDAITARYLFKEYFEFTPQFKLWMGTNFKPKVSGEDPAIWRRIHLLPFNEFIPLEERDGDLPQKLKAEYSGILNWAIEGAIEWAKNGLQPPEEVLAATQGYKSEMDTFSRFCSEIVIKKSGGRISKDTLFGAYHNWRRDEGGDDLMKSELTSKMKRLGYEEGRAATERYWKDIELDVIDPFLDSINNIQ